MKYCKPSFKYLATLLLLLPVFSWAQPYVITPDGKTVQVEKILARSNGDLVVTINGQPRDISKDQYQQAVGVKPAELDQAQGLINQGKGDEAAPILEQIIKDSRYLSWDAIAGEKLAALQLAGGDSMQAKRTVDSLGRRYGNDKLTELFPTLEKVMWNVKVVNNDTVGLEDELSGVIKSDAAPERKALALIVRGDLKASRKDFNAAVLDYLRAHYFFGDNPDIQAESLYKTASMFAKIGDTGRLRKYSTLLKEKYPDSEYAGKPIGS